MPAELRVKKKLLAQCSHFTSRTTNLHFCHIVMIITIITTMMLIENLHNPPTAVTSLVVSCVLPCFQATTCCTSNCRSSSKVGRTDHCSKRPRAGAACAEAWPSGQVDAKQVFGTARQHAPSCLGKPKHTSNFRSSRHLPRVGEEFATIRQPAVRCETIRT